jgi:hypothetical protein
VIAVEDAAGPVPGDLHSDSFGHALVDHVPNGSSPEVVADGSRHTRQLAGGGPRLTEVLPLGAHESRGNMHSRQVREQPRNDPPESALQGLDALHLRAEKSLQLRGQIDETAIVVLGRAGFEAECLRVQVKLVALKGQHLTLRAPPERVG